MQTTIQTQLRLFVSVALISMSLTSCFSNNNETFEDALKKARDGNRNEVSQALNGIPFYTVKNLNPTWNPTQIPIVQIQAMELIAQDSLPRNEELFRKKVSIVGFFFSSCHGVCPTLIKKMKQLEQSLKSSSSVQFIAISVDPEHDTPSNLREYAIQMKLDTQVHWTLLTGDKDQIYALARDTFASQAFQRVSSKKDRNFVHSEHLYFLDSKGRLRGVLNGSRLDVIHEGVELVRQLLG